MSFVGSQVMDEGSQSSLSHLITGEGIFNTAACEKLAEEVGLAKCGNSYAIVSIMGPQSGGKSTLLNHLFQTNFKAMDADEGRSQTTQGIWIAQCAGIEPCTLVMDLEGSDGKERGEENNTSFEKQIALFALAVSDVVLINMWCHDIGREHGGNRPLLKIVFEVMLKLFNPHKTTLMFVIRDKTRTPLEKLDPILRSDIQQIWDSIQKPDAHKETPLSNFFNVEVVALCSFEKEEVEFKQQVAGLRRRFFNSKSPGGLAGDREGVVPGTAFSLSAKEMWGIIKENKDLNLPSHKEMVATVRCEEIANEIFDSFGRNEDWRQLKESVKTQAVSDFGKRLSSIYDSCLTGYDMETTYFDNRVRLAKRKDLEAKIMMLVNPTFQLMVAHILSETLLEFKEVFENTLKHGEGFSATAHSCTDSIMDKFDSRCEDASFHQVNWFEPRNDFHRRIDAYIGQIRAGELIKLKASYEKKLSEALSEEVGNLLNGARSGAWPAIRALLHRETVSALSAISAELASFEMDEQFIGNMISNLEKYARDVVISKTRDEAGRVLILMKDRFSSIFIHQSDTATDIQELKQTARSESLKILVVMAAAPMDSREDNIMNQFSTLSDEIFSASQTWEQCQQHWKHFCLETDVLVKQAIDRQCMSIGPFGGPDNEGNLWTYKSQDGHISEIVIRYGIVIDSIVLQGKTGDGSVAYSRRFGGNGGHQTNKLSFGPGEYIVGIDVMLGSWERQTVVYNLCICTNVASYGPYGTKKGTQLSIPTRDGRVVGFFGRSGTYLNAIGVHIVRKTLSSGPIQEREGPLGGKTWDECIIIGPWGGPEGIVWAYRPTEFITKIEIHHGSCIDSLTFHMTAKDGNVTKSPRFGGSGGGVTTEVFISSGEYITGMDMMVGKFDGELVITLLSFHTNITTYGPFGTVSGSKISIPIKDGSVAGFYGRYGK